MTDSSGPGPGSRIKCFNVGIADLGDVEGFDSPTQENVVYGLKFVAGVYRRFVVPNSPGQETFEGLNTDDAKAKVEYTLLKNAEGIWTLIDKPNWIIDIQITPTSVMSGKTDSLKKVINNGSALLSYVPSKKKSVLISEVNDSYYLTRNNEVLSSIPVFLSMVAEFPDSKFKVNRESSTTIIEVFLKNPPEDHIEILPGLSIKWTSEASQKVCGILLTNGEPQSSIPGVEFTASNTINLKKILFNDDIHFRKLSYVDRTLSQHYLTSIMP